MSLQMSKCHIVGNHMSHRYILYTYYMNVVDTPRGEAVYLRLLACAKIRFSHGAACLKLGPSIRVKGGPDSAFPQFHISLAGGSIF